MNQPLNTLPAALKPLLEAAKAVRAQSYSPYSQFAVGAAILGANGEVYAACNVETVAYNNSLHAEMGAISKMVSAGCRSVDTVVVVTSADEPVYPCGFCLQYLSEFGRDSKVVAVSLERAEFGQCLLSELLPSQFVKKHVLAETVKGEPVE